MKLVPQEERILRTLKDNELTSMEIADRTGIGVGSVAAVMTKLQERRLVSAVRELRLGKNRVPQKVWCVVNA